MSVTIKSEHEIELMREAGRPPPAAHPPFVFFFKLVLTFISSTKKKKNKKFSLRMWTGLAKK